MPSKKYRRNIGATDCSALFGLNPYKDAYRVYLEKTYQADPDPTNKFMEWGKRLEPVVLDKYADDNNIKLIRRPFPKGKTVHPEHDFMVGYIDARRPDKPVAVEAKTSGEGWGTLNMERQIQGLFYLTIDPSLEAVDYAVLAMKSREMEYFHCTLDPQVQEAIVEVCVRFWTHNIAKKIPPEPDFTKDSTIDFVLQHAAAAGPQTSLPVVNEELAPLVARIAAIRDEMKPHKQALTPLEKRKRALEAQLVHAMDGATELHAGGRVVKATFVGEAEVSYTRRAYAKLSID